MASTFFIKQREKKEYLCRKLINVFLPDLEERDEANFNTALHFIVSNVAEPALDVNRRDAEDWCRSLARRCEDDSQLGKATRLLELVQELKDLGLKGYYEEPEARIIHLLIGLADRPLSTSAEDPLAQRLVREQEQARRTAEAARKLQEEKEAALALLRAPDTDEEDGVDADSGNEEEEEERFGSDSDLSNWSAEDERAMGPSRDSMGQAAPPAARQLQQHPGAAVQWYGGIQGTGPSAQQACGGVAGAPVAARPVPQDAPLSAGQPQLPVRVLAPPASLRGRLVTASGLPHAVAGWIAPHARMLLGLLAALQGRSSEVVCWDDVNCRFHLSDQLPLSADLSAAALRHATRPLLLAATALRRLGDWVMHCLALKHGTHRIQQQQQQRPHKHDQGRAGGSAPTTPRGGSGAAGGKAPHARGAGGDWQWEAAGVESAEVPGWLARAAGLLGQGQAPHAQYQPVVLPLGPTLQSLHQAVSSCLHALRAPLVAMEQRIAQDAAAAASPAVCNAASGPRLPSLHELMLSCQPVLRKGRVLVSAYSSAAVPVVAQIAAAAEEAAERERAASWEAVEAAHVPTGHGSHHPRGRSQHLPHGPSYLNPRYGAQGQHAQAGGHRREGGAGSGQQQGGSVVEGAGQQGVQMHRPGHHHRNLLLQQQAGLILERLHDLNERGWLHGVFKTLEGHSARCLLLYLYLSALEPTLDGLGEWLWAATGRIASSSASAAAAAYAGASELPVDFFIARGGAPGKPPVAADDVAFWREGYAACMRPKTQAQHETAAAAPSGPEAAGAGAATGAGAVVRSGAPRPQLPPPALTAGNGGTQSQQHGPGGASASAAGAAALAASASQYLCPPFLEPLMPSIMAAGKSLRLRQRDVDTLEAAGAATAGAAAPSYGTVGSAVIDPVALEESYAMYGLPPADYDAAFGSGAGGMPYSSRWGGAHDLKRCLMERLLSYLEAPLQLPLAPATGVMAAAEVDVPAAVRDGVQYGGGMASPFSLPTLPHTPARFAAWVTLPAPAQAAPFPSPGATLGPDSAEAIAPHGTLSAVTGAGTDGAVNQTGLWQRMESSGVRLRALCATATATTAAAEGPPCNSAAFCHGAQQRLYYRQAHLDQRQQQQQQLGQPGSPVTPLDGQGLSAGSSPGQDEAERARVSEQQEACGWWPQRTAELMARGLLQGPQGPGAAAGREGQPPGAQRLPRTWLHMQQLLRAGPHLPRPRRQPAAAQALQGLPPNGYRHPAMDLLLLHACGASSTSAPLAHNALEHTGSGAAAGAGALLRSPAGPAWAGAGTLDGTGKGDDAGAGGPGASAFNRAAGQLGQGLGLPHPHELLQRGLAEPLQDRADHVNDALLLKLLGGWGLEARLASLPAVFLLSSPAVRCWADRLVGALLGGAVLGEPPLEEHQLEEMLQDELASASPDDLLPPATNLELKLLLPPAEPHATKAAGATAAATAAGPGAAGASSAAAQGADGARRLSASGVASALPGTTGVRSRGPAAGSVSGAGGGSAAGVAGGSGLQAVKELDRSIGELERLRLGVTPSWIIALVADERALRAYSQVLVFMLQLRWVRAALDAAHKSVSLAWRAAATARHANRFPPLRRRTLAPGAGTLQRSNSAGAVTLASLSSSAATSAAVGRPPLGGGGSILSSASGGGTAAPGRPGSGRLSYSGAGGVVGAGGAGGAQGPGLAAGQVPYVPGLPLRTMLSRMLHFMGVLQQWVSTQMVHDAWAQLEQDLATSRSLDDVCVAHTAYTHTLLRRCFRDPRDTADAAVSRHLGAAVGKCLDACLRFTAAVSALVSAPAPAPPSSVTTAAAAAPPLPNPLTERMLAEARTAAHAFSANLAYAVKFMSARALTNPMSDLADLLMRLNYNGVYDDFYLPEELVAASNAHHHNHQPTQHASTNTSIGSGYGKGAPGNRHASGLADKTTFPQNQQQQQAVAQPWHGVGASVGASVGSGAGLQRRVSLGGPAGAGGAHEAVPLRGATYGMQHPQQVQQQQRHLFVQGQVPVPSGQGVGRPSLEAPGGGGGVAGNGGQ